MVHRRMILVVCCTRLNEDNKETNIRQNLFLITNALCSGLLTRYLGRFTRTLEGKRRRLWAAMEWWRISILVRGLSLFYVNRAFNLCTIIPLLNSILHHLLPTPGPPPSFAPPIPPCKNKWKFPTGIVMIILIVSHKKNNIKITGTKTTLNLNHRYLVPISMIKIIVIITPKTVKHL